MEKETEEIPLRILDKILWCHHTLQGFACFIQKFIDICFCSLMGAQNGGKR
jgi:hypothetical protein